jgi:hypothetical protein
MAGFLTKWVASVACASSNDSRGPPADWPADATMSEQTLRKFNGNDTPCLRNHPIVAQISGAFDGAPHRILDPVARGLRGLAALVAYSDSRLSARWKAFDSWKPWIKTPSISTSDCRTANYICSTNGQPVPDGAKMAKVHWTPKPNQFFPEATVPGRF